MNLDEFELDLAQPEFRPAGFEDSGLLALAADHGRSLQLGRCALLLELLALAVDVVLDRTGVDRLGARGSAGQQGQSYA